MKLHKDQRKVLADILGNISTAWFVTGVITPFFVSNSNLGGVIINLLVGIAFGLLFAGFALKVVRK